MWVALYKTDDRQVPFQEQVPKEIDESARGVVEGGCVGLSFKSDGSERGSRECSGLRFCINDSTPSVSLC